MIRSGLLWIATILGAISAALFFLPRVAIDPSGPYDPSSPSPITFTITNNNIVPLRNVNPFLGICFIASNSGNRGSDCNGASGTKIVYAPWFVKWLDSDEKYQIAIEEAITRGGPEQLESANITIGVIYTPWRMPWFWRNTIEFRFVTKKRSDGKIYWVPTPLTR